MDQITRIGIDLAKKVFHVTAVDADGAVVERKRLRRGGCSRIFTAAEGLRGGDGGLRQRSSLGASGARLGHRPVLMNPHFVVPYVSSNKNDVNDADAIAEASSRPACGLWA